eukprot:TRINITY_DN2150_c0_g1_i1.p1 TRINITY_DN2150_c0_g1~~TRINITY_DN2150_c0_g1_i1.p1  ORF type:complete len:218 (-),score=51.71 TRINITY_DN2150_c0_g1_i1:9-662(-)
MNYYSKYVSNGVRGARGELLVRGNNITARYFKNPELTKETIEPDGWLHTGDIACMYPDGAIKLIDRKKNIFKMQHGEYVAPEKLENVYINSEYVAQIFVYGESLYTYLIAIIVPKKEAIMSFAHSNSIEGEFESLCLNPKVKAELLSSLEKIGKKENFVGFEMVKKVHLSPTPFSIENDTLTPTFKLKRFQAKMMYVDKINEMYREPYIENAKPDKS